MAATVWMRASASAPVGGGGAGPSGSPTARACGDDASTAGMSRVGMKNVRIGGAGAGVEAGVCVPVMMEQGCGAAHSGRGGGGEMDPAPIGANDATGVISGS